MTASQQPVRSSRRWLRRGLWSLAILELAYVLAFEWAARSGNLGDWINRRPEKMAISFASAHSYFPFWIRATGLELHGQTPRQRWRLRAERVGGWISPFGLFERTVRFSRADAEGGEFWLRREQPSPAGPEEAAVAKAREARMPPLAALPPLAVPRPATTRPKWSFELPHIAASGFREVWLGQLRLDGAIAARGSFSMYSGRELEVGVSRIEFSGIRAAIGDAEVGRELAGSVDLSIARYPFKEKRGREAFPYVSGRADLLGKLAERELLALFLQRAPWLSFGETPGELTGHLEVEGGRVAPGTHAEFVHPDLETSAFGFRATGDARIDFTLQPDAGGGGQLAELVVKYNDFTVHSGEEARSQIVGSGLTVVATTPALELGAILDSTRVRIDLGTARIPDLAAFNSWIPASSGLTLAGGDGTLTGSLDADLAANDAHGEFRAAIDAAKVRFRDLDLAGSVRVAVLVPSGDLDRRVFDLAGTRLELADFRSPQAEAAGPAATAVPAVTATGADGWWAHLELAEGRLTMPPAATLRGRFAVNLRDSVPLVGLFETRKELPRWVERLLTVQDIRAGGTLAWSPAETALDDLSTQFRKATIRARLRLGREAKRGVLMVEWHRLALGLRVDNRQKNWKLVGVRKWFETADLSSAPRAGPGDDPLSEEALGQAPLAGATKVAGPAAGELADVELPDVDFAFEIVPGSAVSGELDGDPGREAVAVIALPDLARPQALRLAAVDLVDGRAMPIGSLELVAGTELHSVRIADRVVVAEFLVPAPGDAGEAPTGKQTLTWRPRSGTPGEVSRHGGWASEGGGGPSAGKPQN